MYEHVGSQLDETWGCRFLRSSDMESSTMGDQVPYGSIAILVAQCWCHA